MQRSAPNTSMMQEPHEPINIESITLTISQSEPSDNYGVWAFITPSRLTTSQFALVAQWQRQILDDLVECKVTLGKTLSGS